MKNILFKLYRVCRGLQVPPRDRLSNGIVVACAVATAVLLAACPSSDNGGNTPPDSDGDGVVNDMDVDDDNDGLIEINFLEDLDFVRHNLAGTGYKTTAAGDGVIIGAPKTATTDCGTNSCTADAPIFLCGYELARTLTVSVATDYRSGTVNMDWTDDAGPDTGWIPIANNKGANEAEQDLNRFNAIFDGNWQYDHRFDN